MRWLEWGIQSYFRILFGLTIALFGTAVAITRLVPRWLGLVALLGGGLSIAAGVDVGYQGLASGLQDKVIPAFQLAILVFAIGVLATGMRTRSAW